MLPTWSYTDLFYYLWQESEPVDQPGRAERSRPAGESEETKD